MRAFDAIFQIVDTIKRSPKSEHYLSVQTILNLREFNSIVLATKNKRDEVAEAFASATKNIALALDILDQKEMA